MIETVEEFGNRWRDRALEAELEVERLKAQLAAQTTTEGRADQAALHERYATAIHDAMEPDLSLVDQEPAYQALIARAAEAALALADAGSASGGEQRSCGDAKRHPAHTFMRMDVLFQCPGLDGAEPETESRAPSPGPTER